jgi:hypothetical protein
MVAGAVGGGISKGAYSLQLLFNTMAESERGAGWKHR